VKGRDSMGVSGMVYSSHCAIVACCCAISGQLGAGDVKPPVSMSSSTSNRRIAAAFGSRRGEAA